MIQKERIVICLTCKKKYYVTEDQDGIIDSLEVCKKCKTKMVDINRKGRRTVIPYKARMYMVGAESEVEHFIKWTILDGRVNPAVLKAKNKIKKKKFKDLIRRGDEPLFIKAPYHISKHYGCLEKWNKENNTCYKNLMEFFVWAMNSGLQKRKIARIINITDSYVLKLYRSCV